MKQSEVLFILSNGKVAAISKWDGNILWEVKLKNYMSSSMQSTIGQLMVEGDKIFIGISGILLCLSTADGSLLWKNELKGWGYQFISLANVNNNAEAASAARAAAATASVVATT